MAAFLYLFVLLLHHLLLLPPKTAGLETLEQKDKALPCSAAQVMAKSLPNVGECSQFALRSLNKQTNPLIIAFLPGDPDQERVVSLVQHCQQEGAIFQAIFIGWTLNTG